MSDDEEVLEWCPVCNLKPIDIVLDNAALDTDTSIETNLDIDFDAPLNCNGFNNNIGCKNEAKYNAKHKCCKRTWLSCDGCKKKCEETCKSFLSVCGTCNCPMPTVIFTEL